MDDFLNIHFVTSGVTIQTNQAAAWDSLYIVKIKYCKTSRSIWSLSGTWLLSLLQCKSVLNKTGKKEKTAKKSEFTHVMYLKRRSIIFSQIPCTLE
jgi:hypothetical protein